MKISRIFKTVFMLDFLGGLSIALRELFIKQALQREGYYIRKDFIVIPVPNIINITYGRDVGYSIEQEVLEESIEAISATEIRNANK